MEEVDLRIGEAKKSTYEFKRDVVMAGDAAAGGGISADRVVRCVRLALAPALGTGVTRHPPCVAPILTRNDPPCRFFEDKVYGKEVLLEKVTLKNTTYKAAIAKLEAQLAHKEEMGEVLHLVDFDQLKIENQQHMETIDTKNKELIRLKLTTGKTVQARCCKKTTRARTGAHAPPPWHTRARTCDPAGPQRRESPACQAGAGGRCAARGDCCTQPRAGRL
jgi:hypothetical protein